MSRFLLLSLSCTEPLKVQGPQPDVCVDGCFFFMPFCYIYIYIFVGILALVGLLVF